MEIQSNDGDKQGWYRLVGFCFPAAAGALLILSVIFAISVHFRQPKAFNPDDLFPVEFSDDLLRGAPLEGWHLPTAPYLFPDIALLVPCRLLCSDLGKLWLAYGLVYHAATVMILTWIGCLLGLSWRRAWYTACLSVCLLVVVQFAPACSWRAKEQIHAGTHLGVVLGGLAFIAFVLRAMRSGFRFPGILLCVLLTGAAVFSDRLLLLQFLGPVCAALVLIRLAGWIPLRQLVAVLGIVFCAVIVSVGCKVFLERQGIRFLNMEPRWGIESLEEVRQHLMQFWDYTRAQRVPWVLNGLFLGAATAGTWIAGRRVLRGEPAVGLLTLSMVGLLCWLGSFAPFFILKDSQVTELERYSHPIFVLAPLLLGLLWQLLWYERSPRLASGGLVLMLAFISLTLGKEAWSHGRPVLHQPYPRLARIIDRLARERDCHYGFAGYWHARSLSYLTREKVGVVPLYQLGEPLIHASNPDSFLSRELADLEAPAYRFVVVGEDWPVAEAIRKRFGQPRERIPADDLEVWVYDRITDPDLEVFLDSIVARRLESSGQAIGKPSPSALSKPKDGFRRTRPGDLVTGVLPGSELNVSYAEPVQGNLLDIAANPQAEFDVTLYSGSEALGTVRVPRVKALGSFPEYGPTEVRSRLVRLPSSISERSWNRAAIRPQHSSPVVLAHFLLYRE